MWTPHVKRLNVLAREIYDNLNILVKIHNFSTKVSLTLYNKIKFSSLLFFSPIRGPDIAALLITALLCWPLFSQDSMTNACCHFKALLVMWSSSLLFNTPTKMMPSCLIMINLLHNTSQFLIYKWDNRPCTYCRFLFFCCN